MGDETSQHIWPLWVRITVAALALTSVLYAAPRLWERLESVVNPAVQPVSARIDYNITPEQRNSLPPHVVRLLDDIENDRLTGMNSSEIADTLKLADNVERRRQTLMYYFRVDRQAPELETSVLEGHPVIYVGVDHKTQRVVYSGMTVPCW